MQVLQGEETEIIKAFWKLAAECNLFVGHNILDFDLRFIYQRSIIHQIKPSRDLPFARFRNAPIQVLQGEETDIIRNFWKLAIDCNLFVGHNILDFDMRFLYQRSVIHQIKPLRDIPFTRFRNAPIFDTMQEWSKWGREHVSLDTLSKALDIPSPKESLDGSKAVSYTHLTLPTILRV